MSYITVYNTVDGNGFDQSTLAWLNQLTVQPSYAYQTALNTLIVQMKLSGIWNQLDVMWLFTTEQQQHARIDIKSLTTLTEVNSPFWSPYSGYTSDGISSYLNLNYVPLTGVNFTQNNMSMGVYNLTNTNTVNGYELGCYVTGGTYNATFMTSRQSGDAQAWTNINFNVSNSITNTTSANSQGMTSAYRTGATGCLLYYRGAVITTSFNTTSSVAPCSASSYSLAVNRMGSPTFFTSGRTQSMVYFGSANINQFSFYNIYQQFAITLGFAV